MIGLAYIDDHRVYICMHCQARHEDYPAAVTCAERCERYDETGHIVEAKA